MQKHRVNISITKGSLETEKGLGPKQGQSAPGPMLNAGASRLVSGGRNIMMPAPEAGELHPMALPLTALLASLRWAKSHVSVHGPDTFESWGICCKLGFPFKASCIWQFDKFDVCQLKGFPHEIQHCYTFHYKYICIYIYAYYLVSVYQLSIHLSIYLPIYHSSICVSVNLVIVFFFLWQLRM